MRSIKADATTVGEAVGDGAAGAGRATGDGADTARRGDCFSRACLARTVLSHLSGRWGMLIVAVLRANEHLRFSELRARVDGISEKVLSEKLRELESDGVLTRTAYPVVPPRTEYRLTPLGRGVAEHVEALIRWIEANVDAFSRPPAPAGDVAIGEAAIGEAAAG